MENIKDNFSKWSNGYGVIQHHMSTQAWVQKIIENYLPSTLTQLKALKLFEAADRICNAAMWLVVHQTYAKRINLVGSPLKSEDFKLSPQGHVGGSLNMVPAYVGYMLANALSGITRGWVMGQGHCVAAIDSVNLILNNMLPAHADRYALTEEGLNRYINDFYSYRLNNKGEQDSPLGSHVNINTAGGCLEGGYLGFADLQYVHMPLNNERLIAFLSDGAFEEQRGSDWTPRWWRAEDSGSVIPIMIFNGRRIDQRAMISQGPGLSLFIQHLRTYHFDPIIFDGADPAAFACMILFGEQVLKERCQLIAKKKESYPVLLPYGVAVAKKGAGFYGAGTNAAHNLPLSTNPHTDVTAKNHFNKSVKKLFVPIKDIIAARDTLNNHHLTNRVHERDNSIANRIFQKINYPSLTFLKHYKSNTKSECPMTAIDNTFLAYVKANPDLRPRVGNPDEMISNHMINTLNFLKHRVTEVEKGIAESIYGKVITVLNEEAVVCACLANKAGINLVVTYEAFSPKMLGAIRQEINWSNQLSINHRHPNWISVPIILTSHTYENGKNERSHQDTTMCEVLLNEPSNISRVLFPPDYNTAIAALDYCYHTRGKILTLLTSKDYTTNYFNKNKAQQLIKNGISCLTEMAENKIPDIIITAIGSYQLQQVFLATKRLADKNITFKINYMIEPGRFRNARSEFEKSIQTSEDLRQNYFPPQIKPRIFITHTRPETMAGILRPLDTGNKSIFLGFINNGGTLNNGGMMYVNHQSWAHIIIACAKILDVQLSQLLEPNEIAALNGYINPQGVII